MALFAALALVFVLADFAVVLTRARDRCTGKQTTPTPTPCGGEKQKTSQLVVVITLVVLVFHLFAIVEAMRNRSAREQTAPTPAPCDREKKEPLQAVVLSALFNVIVVFGFVFAKPMAGCERGNHATAATSARR